MNSIGIREAKARLSALARAAARGEPTLLTDYGKPLAVITALVENPEDGPSDPFEFRKALLAMPYPLIPAPSCLPTAEIGLTSWLIDTALFKSLAPGPAQHLRKWFVVHDDPIFLSVASLVELRGAIAKMPDGHAQHAEALRQWMEGIVSGFGDRIHPIDNEIASRAGTLLPQCQVGHLRHRLHRLHDALLVATAQVHGHGLLTMRDAVFGAWTNVKVASP